MTILLIDDERDFFDGREYDLARSSNEAIALFSSDGFINDKNATYDEVWLDFSLRGSDSIMEFVFFATNMMCEETPLKVGKFVIHTSSWGGASLIKTVLEESGYITERFDIKNFSNKGVLGTYE